MAKAEVAKETLSFSEVSALVREFVGVELPLKEHGVLFGGYSGTSIRVTGADGSRAVLKLCHGYGKSDAAAQAAVAAHCAAAGFTGVCAPLPLKGKSGGCVYERGDGTPVMLLSWVEGVAADKVLSAGEVESGVLLGSIGAGLAALHSVPVSTAAACRLRACEAGSGACDVAKHMSGELLAKMRASEHTRSHGFVSGFYEPEAASLVQTMKDAALPRGVLHGDPFLDNMLVDPRTGGLAGLVDLEDLCLGPLLFDVACCASACCFRADGAFDVRRLRHLLQGYSAVRPLEKSERETFLAFMRLTMLCNCTWRFVNFNIDHREIDSCRDAHVELQERIEALHEDINVAAVEAVLRSLPTAPTAPPPFFVPAPLHRRLVQAAASAIGVVDERLLTAAAVGTALLAVGAAIRLARRRA